MSKKKVTVTLDHELVDLHKLKSPVPLSTDLNNYLKESLLCADELEEVTNQIERLEKKLGMLRPKQARLEQLKVIKINNSNDISACHDTLVRHLPGMCAAIFEGPVVGIPMKTSDLGGVDSLYSIVQMPTGVPVATVAINGGANAGILAVKMLAMADSALAAKMHDFIVDQKEQVESKDNKLQNEGYKAFL